MSTSSLRLFILILCVSATLFILQGAFDQSDHRKADHAVRTYTVGGRQLGPYLEARAPGGAWSTEITHSCRGIVRTTYAAPSGAYAFDYDVPGHTIHPGNELGRAALEGFVAQPDGGVDGGARDLR